VSHVLLWQPSECVHLIVMIVLSCFRNINMMMMKILAGKGISEHDIIFCFGWDVKRSLNQALEARSASYPQWDGKLVPAKGR